MVPHPPENVTSIRLSSPPTKVNYIIVANNGFMTTFSSRKRFDYIMEYAGIMGVPPTNIILTSNNLFNGFDMTASWLFQLFRQPLLHPKCRLLALVPYQYVGGSDT